MNDIFTRIAELKREGRPFALATVVHSEDSTPRQPGARMIIFPDSMTEGTVGGGALEKRVTEDAVQMLSAGKTDSIEYDLGKGEEGVPVGMICGGRVQVLIESFSLAQKLFIFGAGHVGRKLAELCEVLNIAYWIIDDREEFARKELFPGAMDVVHADFKESFKALPIDEKSSIIIVTYGHRFDGVCLEGSLGTKACYIGMIGSSKKVKTILDSLSGRGMEVHDDRIYAPIGLDLGDSTPEEIGVSVLSEILKIKSGGTGKHMRDLSKS